MPKPLPVDPYVYPGTQVLINKFNLTHPDELARMEGIVFALQNQLPLPEGNLDYTHLKAIHHHFFSDIYDWAGQERTVDIAKDNHLFAHTPYITSELNKLFLKLKNEQHLRGLNKPAFSERLSYYFNEINAAHPFREGNGRTQRAFCDAVAHQAGFSLDWTKVSTDVYIQASIAGHLGNYKAMTAIFQTIATAQTQSQSTTLEISSVLKAKLTDYIQGQATLTDKLNQRHTSFEPSEKIHAMTVEAARLSQALKSQAKQLLADNDVIALLEKAPLIPLHQQGGFAAIAQRIQTQQWQQQDVLCVLQYAKRQATSLSKTVEPLSYTSYRTR